MIIVFLKNAKYLYTNLEFDYCSTLWFCFKHRSINQSLFLLSFSFLFSLMYFYLLYKSFCTYIHMTFMYLQFVFNLLYFFNNYLSFTIVNFINYLYCVPYIGMNPF
uniref:Uncharacterized protein n=1 Tax=Cacopsylla melanoneura TaxID=428564 RepID=A0A8D9EFV2_9HEMI